MTATNHPTKIKQDEGYKRQGKQKKKNVEGEEPAKVYSVSNNNICGVAPRQHLLQKIRKEEEARRGGFVLVLSFIWRQLGRQRLRGHFAVNFPGSLGTVPLSASVPFFTSLAAPFPTALPLSAAALLLVVIAVPTATSMMVPISIPILFVVPVVTPVSVPVAVVVPVAAPTLPVVIMVVAVPVPIMVIVEFPLISATTFLMIFLRRPAHKFLVEIRGDLLEMHEIAFSSSGAFIKIELATTSLSKI